LAFVGGAALLLAGGIARLAAGGRNSDGVGGDAPPSAALAGASAGSVYDLHLEVVGTDGARHPLEELRGHPVVAAMFFASCPSICPLLINDLQRLETTAPASIRRDLRVLLVSFDPARDTPAVLQQAIVHGHGLDPQRWRVAVAPDDDTARVLAAALGTRYRAGANGMFDHTTDITLLDTDGRVRARSVDPQAIATDLAAMARQR
jgi:protein SCO1/2